MIIVHVLNGDRLDDIEATVVVNDADDAKRFIARCKAADALKQFSFVTKTTDMQDDVVALIADAAVVEDMFERDRD